ncbi:MAG: hypothetical protein ACJ754_28745 [Pyrinomonadaceae bacterium]
MNNAPTPDGRGQDRPNDAEPLFPSEGSFNPVVPLSEVGHGPAPLTHVNPADVGKPAEAAWAREAHRARLKEEETLVPARAARARRARQSWFAAAAVIALSVVAGLASGTYLIWSSQRAHEAQTPARVEAEAPSLPPAPAVEQEKAVAKVERPNESAKVEKPSEVAKAEKPEEVSHAPKPAQPPQPAPRTERPTRAAAEPKEVAAPQPARVRSAASSRPRVTTAEKRPPAPQTAERTPPISSPPPTAKSRKVIQWP